LYKNLGAKFPTILDNFYLVLTVSGEFQHGWAGGRQDGSFKERGVWMHQAKLWATQVVKLAKMKGNL